MARRFNSDDLLDVGFASADNTRADFAVDSPWFGWEGFAIEALALIDQHLIENKADASSASPSRSDISSIAVFQLSSLHPINGGDGTDGFVISGIDTEDFAGISVSSAGDINGDGVDDIVIGAYRADPTGNTAGESYVIFGRDTGFNARLGLANLNGNNGFVINGVDGGDFSGRAVSSAGDVNGDGFDDIIIGATLADPGRRGSAGESYVIYGTDAGFSASLDLSSLNGMNGFVINGIDGGDNSGTCVSSAGDINGDGYDDIIIGANFADPNGSRSGESYVVLGSATSFGASLDLSTLDGTNGFVLNGINADDQSGGAVSSAGDINGDGFDDIIIGAAEADTNGNIRSGESYVVFGSGLGFSATLELSALDGSNGFVISGIAAGDNNGNSVAPAGDINGDGYDDVLIASHRAGSNGKTNAGEGETYVIFGGDKDFSTSFDLTALDGSNGFVIKGIDDSDQSGVSVSSAGDINGDGFDDILIGSYRASKNTFIFTGESYVVFGSDAGFAASLELSTLNGSNGFVIEGIQGQGSSGASVSAAGDINGDGFDDILIGAPTSRKARGDSYVIYGQAEFSPETIALSTADDFYKITGGSEVVMGLAGNDLLVGANASDALYGDSGNDMLRGGRGNDVLDGGDGDDLIYGQIGQDDIRGGAGMDIIRGSAGNDMIFGGNDDDDLNGNAGNDIINGGTGNDDLVGESGADILNGDDGNDNLFGASGGDDLFGGDGDDTINGGGGSDDLNGGDGADIFVANLGFKTDRIQDFEDGVDRIDFSSNSLANNITDILAAASQIGSSIRIDLNPNNVLILENFDLADLDASDFIF